MLLGGTTLGVVGPLLSFQGTTPLWQGEGQLLCLGPRVKKGLWGAEQSRAS